MDEYDRWVAGNLLDRTREPGNLKDPVPIKSKLYDILPYHFPEVWKTWNEHRNAIEHWALRSVDLFNSVRESVQKNLEIKLPCSCPMAWHHLMYDFVKDVYSDLFSADAHRTVDEFVIGPNDGPSVEYGGRSAVLTKDEVPRVEAAKRDLRELVKKSTEASGILKEDARSLVKSRQDAESAIRNALATLELNGTCQFCK